MFAFCLSFYIDSINDKASLYSKNMKKLFKKVFIPHAGVNKKL